MRALRTQFDVDEFAGVVATPTCSSCCCCSCCVTTVVGAGAIAATATARAAAETGRPRAAVLRLSVFAALIPLLALLAAVLVLWAFSESLGVQLTAAIAVVFLFLAIGYHLLFRALRDRGAVAPAIGVSFLVLLALGLEVFISVPLLLSGYPAVYLVLPVAGLTVVAIALRKPAVRERLARNIRGGGADEPPSAHP